MPQPDIEVKKAETDEEIKSLYSLLKLLFEEIESPEDLLVKVRLAEKQGQEIYIGLVGGQIVSCICVEYIHRPFVGLGAYIDGLVIDPEYRNSAIFDEVIRYAALRAAARKVKCSTFHRDITNTQLFRFSEKYGFTVSSTSFVKEINDPPLSMPPLKLRWGSKIYKVETAKTILGTAPFLGHGYIEDFDPDDYVSINVESLKFYSHFLKLSRFALPVGAACYKIVEDPFWGKIGYLVRADVKNDRNQQDNLKELLAEAERQMINEGVHKIFMDMFPHQPYLEPVYLQMGYEKYGYRYVNTDLKQANRGSPL